MTDANGVAALNPTVSNFYSGTLVLQALGMTESVTFNATLRRLTVAYSPVAGNLIQTHRTELLNHPFIIAYDAPGTSIPTPYGIVTTGLLAPLATTVIRDGVGAFGPPDPTIVSDGNGEWFNVDVIPIALRNSGIPIVIQSYAAPVFAPWFVSNTTTISL